MANKNYSQDVEIKETKSEKLISWQERLVEHVKLEWERGYQYCESLNDLFDDLYDMLRGERPEKKYDWQSNLVINKVFPAVWTIIPYLMRKVFGATPIVGVKGNDKDGAQDRENLLEFWHNLQPSDNSPHIPFRLIAIMWILRACLNGVGIIKKSYRRKIRNGVPIADYPVNFVVNNKDIVYDWLLQPGQSIRQGRFITHRIMTDLDALYSSDIKYMNLDKLEPSESQTDGKMQQDHAVSKRKDNQQTPPDSDIYTDIEIYEREGVFPVYKDKKDGQWIPCFDKEIIYDGSGNVVFREMICTTVPSQNVLIRFEPNPYGEKNYIDFHIFLDPERWNSTGPIEPVKDIQTGINDNINAAFDEIWQNLFAPAIFNKFALWDWDTVQYAPQQRWLVGGNPADAVKWKEPSNITSDAWQKHLLLDNEFNLTSAVTPPMQGMGKEKAATTNIMNAQLSASRLDFIVLMFELTALIPSVQMDVRFSKKFTHPKTFERILGRPHMYSDFTEEVYKYVPAASSVKLEHQKDVETQQDVQLMQITASVPNPNTPKILNYFLKNIYRNRGEEEAAALLDEDYFEPQSEAGNINMINRMLGGEVASNEKGIPMSRPEKNVRMLSYNQAGRR